MSYCCFLWSLLAFALPVLCRQLLPSVYVTGAEPTRSVSDPLVFQVIILIIIQKWEKPGADITAAYTSPSNLRYCPGPRTVWGAQNQAQDIILHFPAYTRNKDLFFVVQLYMFGTVFSLIYVHSLAPGRLSPQSMLWSWAKLLFCYEKGAFNVQYCSYHLYSSWWILLIPSV